MLVLKSRVNVLYIERDLFKTEYNEQRRNVCLFGIRTMQMQNFVSKDRDMIAICQKGVP